MIDFYRTVGGRRFVDGTVPELVVQLQRIANALDRILDLAEASRAEAPASPKKEDR